MSATGLHWKHKTKLPVGQRHVEYRYEALDTGTRSFRLIEILADHESTPVRFNLTPSDFDGSCPTYTALSYSWQCPIFHPEVQVFCNNSPMHIGYNLWSFLHQFRKAESTRCLLWVDAICIDQKNTQERNHQVAQMRNIYSKAERVIVWLGADVETDEATQAFDLVIGPKRLLYQDDHRDMRWHRSRKQWWALEKLLNRSYWSRVWIIQEFILAKVVEIRCGNRTSPLENFKNICRWLEEFSKPFKSRHSGSADIVSSKAYRLIKHRTEWWRTNGDAPTFSLRRLFEAYTSSESSERRDKVYALLGLACNTSDGGNPIYADYSRSSVGILIDVVRNQCQWGTRSDELENQRLVLLLKEALWVGHEQVQQYVLQSARDLYSYLHILTTTDFVQTQLDCIGTIIEVGFTQNDQGLASKRSFRNWYERPRDWNSYIAPERLSNIAVRNIMADFNDAEHDSVLIQEVWESYGQYASSMDDIRKPLSSRQPIAPPGELPGEREIFVATNGICGITRSCVQSGDVICVDPSRSNTRAALILRRFGRKTDREHERTISTAIFCRQKVTQTTYTEEDYLILDQVTSSNQAIYSAKYKSEDFITQSAWSRQVAETGTLERRHGYRVREKHATANQRAEFYFRPIYLPALQSHGLISSAQNAPEPNVILVRTRYYVSTSGPYGYGRNTDGQSYDPELKKAMSEYERQDFIKQTALAGVPSLRVRQVETGLFPPPPFIQKHKFP